MRVHPRTGSPSLFQRSSLAQGPRVFYSGHDEADRRLQRALQQPGPPRPEEGPGVNVDQLRPGGQRRESQGWTPWHQRQAQVHHVSAGASRTCLWHWTRFVGQLQSQVMPGHTYSRPYNLGFYSFWLSFRALTTLVMYRVPVYGHWFVLEWIWWRHFLWCWFWILSLAISTWVACSMEKYYVGSVEKNRFQIVSFYSELMCYRSYKWNTVEVQYRYLYANNMYLIKLKFYRGYRKLIISD